MKIRSVIPAATASSTAYWMSGLSTIGSISLGEAFVAGRKRVPSPATGKTALVTLVMYAPSSLFPQHREELLLLEHADPEAARAIELRSRLGARDHVVGLLRDRSRDLPAGILDALLRLVAPHLRQRSGEDHDLTREGAGRS